MVDFNPRYCKQCSYDLTGLPAVSRCPECGQPFNQNTGMGVKLKEKEDSPILGKIMRHFVSGCLFSITGLIIFVVGINYLLKAIGSKEVYAGLLFAGAILIVAVYRFLHERW